MGLTAAFPVRRDAWLRRRNTVGRMDASLVGKAFPDAVMRERAGRCVNSHPSPVSAQKKDGLSDWPGSAKNDRGRNDQRERD